MSDDMTHGERRRMSQWHELPRRMREAAIADADRELRAQHERGIFDDGDPNHPKYNNGINYTKPLFGYGAADFMAKQYDK